jgi:pimeloyl-ACP methyl ester carboxylesterase
MCRRVGPAAYLRQLQAMVALKRYDSLPDLHRVGCPTLVIHGRQDGTFSLAEHEAIADAIPKAKLAVVEECGHESPLEQPQAVTALLRQWLLST